MFNRRIWITAALFLLSLNVLAAQSQERRGRELGSPTGSAATPQVRSVAPATSPTGSTAPASPAGASGLQRYGSAAAFPAPANSGIPVQTYTPGLRSQWGHWRNTEYFLWRLSRQHHDLTTTEMLWRFAQGDSPLTEQSIRAILQEPAEISEQMLHLSAQLQDVIHSYRTGSIDADQLQRLVRAKTSEIRKAARKISGNYYLGYIDQRSSEDLGKEDRAASLEQLSALSEELGAYARQLNQDLSNYLERDQSRVVSVQHLATPSFESVSKGIDRLAKTIDRSAGRASRF